MQLRHELPEGSWHIDWMLGQDRAGSAKLVTFRLPRPLVELSPGQSLEAIRLAEHRPAYLDYEGPISGNRGIVTQIAKGDIIDW
ncbi:MAG: hypothetical protein O7G85_01920, partial [Planctomycetota bacterium]|nr:hypothetical protein [Planctomycetota bacterium]